MKTWFLIILCLTFGLLGCSRSEKKPEKDTLHDVSAHEAVSPVQTHNLKICPAPDTLKKNPKTLMWAAPGGWESPTPSFANSIAAFSGAQWQGILNGKVICIYAGAGGNFSIALQTNQFVARPVGEMWHRAEGQTGGVNYYNCVAGLVDKCPFPSSTITWDPKAPPPVEDIKAKPEF